MDANGENRNTDPASENKKRSPLLRLTLLLGCVLSLAFVVGSAQGQSIQSIAATFDAIFHAIGLSSDVATAPALKASPAVFSEHLLEKLDSQPVQQQAEVLMQGSINHYAGAIEQISSRVDGWHGQLKRTNSINELIVTGLNSNDLRVRAASIEIQLAVNNVNKDVEAVDSLRGMLQSKNRAYALWTLGALANRGVQHEQIREILEGYLQDPDSRTREMAVGGYELLGTDETIAPLLDRFHNDPSLGVRDRAACAIAQSGMFTTEQRMKAVPELLKFTDDPVLDKETQRWAFQALRDITGQVLPPDPAAWRNWYASREAASPSQQRTGESN
jgi:hypothetical protein